MSWLVLELLVTADKLPTHGIRPNLTPSSLLPMPGHALSNLCAKSLAFSIYNVFAATPNSVNAALSCIRLGTVQGNHHISDCHGLSCPTMAKV
ncbi:hypothetical protein Pyn_03261 [Prunus yedoensis var. nudiflora]|uniref:Uncharacterized protein n=1 Tax=Prunus yedoensis var. nudiflora TaxID=2094558 RepID=A0A314ZMZ2_PRUYE|nr:hypothetical protein Pyn_03261 [Prunus yedoensis var. nudiflora]